MQLVIIGIDLGKNSCSLVGLDALGRVVLRRRMRRSSVKCFVAGLGRCIVAMEACCGAHHLGGLPLELVLTPGQAGDCPAAAHLLGHLLHDAIVLADKGYDADWLRRQTEAAGAAPNIPLMLHRRWKPCFSPRLY